MTTAQLARQGRQLFFSVDRVWLVFGAIFMGLIVLDPPQATVSAGKVVENLLHIGPYLILAIGAAAYAGATNADHLIARAFQGRVVPMIVVASLFGALSPFCSCGVIPLIAALLSMGVPLAAVMSFWLASPIMDPTMFFITAGELGTDFAIAKTGAAIAIGLLGGFGVLALSNSRILADPLRPQVGNGGCGGAKVRAPKPVKWAFWQDPARRETFWREAVKTFLFLVKWLCIAYLLESLFLAFVPAESVGAFLGSDKWWMIALAGAIGAPLYLNGYAAVPVAAGLVEAGMAPGAAMAFLVGGGVTSIPAAIAVYALAKRPVFLMYLVFAMVGAALSGLGYQLWLQLSG